MRALLGYYLAVCCLLLFLTPEKAEAHDPELIYYTIETEHFRIHYYQGLERPARLSATILERLHRDLAIQLEWEVKGPINVVLSDGTDSANGSAQIMYRPLIRLNVTAPTGGASLQQYDHWLRTLIIHELTHIVSLQIHSGVSMVVNAIFGDVYLPNQVTPRWYSEGIAVLNETYLTSGGRIRSSSFPMTVRTHALEGKLLTLGQVSNDTRGYPRGTGQYIYGAMFMDYLYKRFGIKKIAAVFHEYGSQPIPYSMNRSFKKAFGTDLVTLYDEWCESVKAEAEATKKKLSEQGLTESTRLTDNGEGKGQPVFLPDGKSLIMAIGDGMERSGIYQVPLDGSPRKRLVIAGSATPVSIDRSGRIFYTRTAPFNTYYRYNDIFVLDRPGVDPRRVSFGARAWSAAVSPRGDRIAMSVNSVGTSSLVLADERGNQLRTLIDSKPEDQVYNPAWSPDGKKIAAAIRRGPQVDLAIVDVETGDTEFVTSDRALEQNPAFDSTGRYLLYSSDRTGIANIYALDLVEDRLLQITNVLTGAFSPAVSHDGKTLAFLKYYSTGRDLHVMPFTPEAAREAEPVDDDWETPAPPPEPAEAETHKYNPLPSMLPHYWQLNTSSDTEWNTTLQLVTALSDAVGRHRVGASVSYNIADTVFSGSASYGYGGLGPGIHTGVSHTLNPRETGYEVNGKSKRWIQQVTRGSLGFSYSIPGVDRGHGLSISYSVTQAQPYEEPEIEADPRGDRPEIPRQYFRAGFEMGWSFSETVSSALGISPHNGRKFSASVALYHPNLGGTQTLATFHYKWMEYIKMPWLEHHVVAFRLNGGIHVSDPPKQASFAVGGYGEQNIVDVIWNNTQAGMPYLRGYLPGAFQGDQFHSLKLEYRLPIWFTEVAYATLPVYLKRIQAGIFTDNSVISFDAINRDDWRSSLGAELVWVLAVGYYQPMSLRTGYAYGFMESGIHEVILVIGGGF
ncbi:MAG: hypothetical protein GY854_31590 [Deltaproteobacteria bacterium]|nr:hypothetical protein [Deltaproteobacteria bacterium]